MIEILQFEFMQRALISGIFLALLLGMLGVFVIMRQMSFFTDGVAHASLLGIAIGIIFSQNPLPFAIGVSIVIALLLYAFERFTSAHRDAVIGILFTVSMALGVILMSSQPGYQPELVSFLFGNILSVSWGDIAIIVPFSVLVFFFLLFSYKKISALTLDRDGAKILGMPVTIYEILLYISLAIATVLGVRILGIVLVSALIILPATSAKLISPSLRSMFMISVIVAELTVLLGLFSSYYFDSPSGATIVLVGFGFFILSFGLSNILRPNR